MAKPKKETKSNNGEMLPSELPKEAVAILKEIPVEKRQTLLSALAISMKEHRGPLPDGDTLTVYNNQIPNGGDRLMATVEKQLDHRIKIENIGIERSFNQSSTGQWMAFGIALFFGAVCWDLASKGHDVVAGVIGGIDLVGLVAVFIIGKTKR